jgi:phage terminase small subunit
LVDGIINATESFLRSSEVHRLFIQELVQGTFAEASEDELRVQAVRTLVEKELLAMIEERRQDLLDRVAHQLMDTAKGDFEAARHATEDALEEVERLVLNHADAL